MSHQTPAVKIRAAYKAFDAGPVLNGLNLDIAQGEFVALLGRSGSGKTTLLRLVGGFERVSAGSIEAPLAIATVFQEARLLPWRRAWENVVLGLRGAAPRQRAERALAEVGLATHAQAWPATLSGGQAQRVALARALAREPKLLLLDEPFGALDALTRLEMQALVKALCRAHGPAVLLVTHDVDEAVRLADRVLVLSAGRIVHEEALGPLSRREPDSVEAQKVKRRLLEQLGVAEEPPPATPHLREVV